MTEDIPSIYTVRAGTFEGPLELLLSLIEQRKLFVNEISLASVTAEYIGYIKTLTHLPDEKRIADTSYFILIAATLILIKSKSLLPNLALTEEETEKITDLESRLKLYQIIKNASIDIKSTFGTHVIFFPRERVWSEPLFSPDTHITTSIMASSIVDVLNNAPKQEISMPEVEVKKVVSIDEMIDNLTARIQTAMNMSFREWSKKGDGGTESEVKVHVIVSFLAMLELVREGIINVVQNTSFADIAITKQEEVSSRENTL